ncbi:Bifunctional coenzyme A synthase [Clonorchis sinensis]|uniref:Bifunctional coenzyme A synthase n=1 Tax=Clonorchis sinensis TaxID=79923 RepID=A0A8T1MPR2_CLOSI|nr:Bifunctional coenzyme A synthase [Clonorchis sinensis]
MEDKNLENDPYPLWDTRCSTGNMQTIRRNPDPRKPRDVPYSIPWSSTKFGIDFWKLAVSLCYTTASEICPSLDVRLVLPATNLKDHLIKFDVVLTHDQFREQALQYARILNPHFNNNVLTTSVENNPENKTSEFLEAEKGARIFDSHDHVCLGGTFDRLHNGHKILLSTGALLTKRSMLVGITSDRMLKNKHLAPLIQSFNRRRSDLQCFLLDIGFPKSKLEIVELTDAYGPPAYRSEFGCIVASAESVNNCHKLNEIRTSHGLNPVRIEAIDLVNEPRPGFESLPDEVYEPKLSSSMHRFNLLGTLLRPVNVDAVNHRKARLPYVIGLAGPSGAGKSALARRLANVSPSVHVVDCDKLGHEAYRPDTPCYKALLNHFGFEAIACPEPPHEIDRAKLGKIVFADAQRLAELNQLVWPEIERQVQEFLVQLEEKSSNSKSPDSRPIVILDAAVLLQANWNRFCDEVWIAILTKEEAQRRISERGHLSCQVAAERLARQAGAIAEATGGLDWWDVGQVDTGCGPVGRAHVVLSTQWEPECSQKQVEKAFKLLKERLS